MNEQEFGKKEAEWYDLDLFLTEHARITGIATSVVVRRERPDFEVHRGAAAFGLEVVQVVERPSEKFFRVLFGGREEMTVSDASDAVQEEIYAKEQKRLSAGWDFRDATILVVNLKGCSGSDVFSYWDEDILEQLRATGFVEIWLCDHSPEEPYGTVELIGVKPASYEGVHRHAKHGSKPYG